MLRPPSLQIEYDAYCSVDPAFTQLAEKASPEQIDAHAAAWKRARETGNYIELLAPGSTLADATKFVLRQLSGSLARQLGDLLAKVGQRAFFQLVFRLALVDIVNGPEVGKRALHEDPSLRALGTMAPASVADALDTLDFAIVNQLGILAWVRALDVSPL